MVVKMCDGEIHEIWTQIEYMEDARDSLRNEIASLLENASHSIQFCNDCKEVVEVLVQLLNDLVKVLKV